MDIPTHTDLLDRIEHFRARHDIAETRFGREAINNPNFIRGLRDGISPTLETLIKVKGFMDRVEEEVKLRAKLDAPLEPAAEEAEQSLPFAKAPVNPTGASSPTSSPTTEPPATPAASASCRCSASEEVPLSGQSTSGGD